MYLQRHQRLFPYVTFSSFRNSPAEINKTGKMNKTARGNSSEDYAPLACPFPNLTPTQQFLRAACVLVVFIVSLIGNLFVLYVVRRNSKLHTVTHFLIVNLSAADLLITFINMTVLFQTEVAGNDEAFGGLAGHVYCVGLIVVLNVSVSCSILSLTAIAVERFCSIMFPFKRIITLKIAKAIMVVIWMISFCITIPFFFHIKVEDFYGDGVFYCVEDWSPLDTTFALQVFQVVFFTLLYACPLMFIFVLYLSIGVHLWKRQAQRAVSSLGKSPRRMRMTVQVTKMLVASVVAFALCWLPQHVALFINYFMLDRCPPEFLWFGGTLLAYANSAMNPIIYVAFHSEYRKQFKVILRRCFHLCTPACKTHTGNGLNLDPGRSTKREQREELNMVAVLTFREKTADKVSETVYSVSQSGQDIQSQPKNAFSCNDETH